MSYYKNIKLFSGNLYYKLSNDPPSLFKHQSILTLPKDKTLIQFDDGYKLAAYCKTAGTHASYIRPKICSRVIKNLYQNAQRLPPSESQLKKMRQACWKMFSELIADNPSLRIMLANRLKILLEERGLSFAEIDFVINSDDNLFQAILHCVANDDSLSQLGWQLFTSRHIL